MDARIKAGLEDLTREGEDLLLRNSLDAEIRYEHWAARLEAVLSMVGDEAGSRAVELAPSAGVQQRVTNDLAILKGILRAS